MRVNSNMNSVSLAILFLLLLAGCCRAQQLQKQQQCSVDGRTYEDGASWPSPDGCQECRCSSGIVFCVRVSFCVQDDEALRKCGVVVTPPGACCPVCYGCVTPSGQKVSLNATWMEDDCTTCVCIDGQTKCQASFCRTPCLHPRKVPGECCPVCDDDCHLQCHYGRAVDASGRELCQCRKVPDEDFRDLSAVTIRRENNESDGAKEEHEREEEDEDYVTSTLLLNNSRDNEAISCPKVPCKRMCQHGFQTDRRGCPVCKCQRCKPIQPCHKKCPLGLIHDDRGCPSCQCRSSTTTTTTTTTTTSPVTANSAGKCVGSGNQTYRYGDRWRMDDCTECLCHPGGPTCTEMSCPIPCRNPIFLPGQCCPVCSESGDGSSNQQHRDMDEVPTEVAMSDGTTLLTAVLVCVSLVAGLMLIVAILAFCVARQCRRLRLHEADGSEVTRASNGSLAAVNLTAVHRLRPKSTNLDYQYNLYMHRYRESSPSCWTALDGTERSESSESRGDKDEATESGAGGSSSQCSNSPLLVKSSA